MRGLRNTALIGTGTWLQTLCVVATGAIAMKGRMISLYSGFEAIIASINVVPCDNPMYPSASVW